MESRESEPIEAMLARRIEDGATAEQIADIVVRTLRRFGSALGPVIGNAAVAALLRRSVNLSKSRHPFFGASESAPQAGDIAAGIGAALAKQTTAQAGAAGAAFLETFRDLLSSLIGSSLTARLLAPAVNALSVGSIPQDSSR